jgi:hypothetical protein
VVKSSSKKGHQNVKKNKSSGSNSTGSSSKKISFEEMSNNDTGSSIPRKRKRRSESSLIEEFKKAKPPTFDGEIKKREVEGWLLGLKKHFRVHNYSENTKARIAIFNLNGGASIRWEDLKELKGLKESKLTWRQFEKYF